MGESSCKKHSHDSTSNGRPLKKAKFPWQVKGKYHLKDQDETMEDPVGPDGKILPMPSESDEVATVESNTIEEKHFDNKVEENLEMLGDYLLKKDFGSIDALLLGPENEQSSKKHPETSSTSTDQSASTTYPKYTPSYKRVPNSNNNDDSSISSINSDTSDSNDIDNNESSSTAPYLGSQFTKLDEQHMQRWQARQVNILSFSSDFLMKMLNIFFHFQLAKGYVDNTINRVLDSWFFSPLPPYLDVDRHTYLVEHQLRLNVTDFLEDLDGDDVIENEGILMAISAHGLQNNQDDSRNVNAHRQLPPGIRLFYSRNQIMRRLDEENAQQDSSDSHEVSQSPSNSGKQETDENSPNETTSKKVDNNSNENPKCEHSNENIPHEPPAWRHLSDACNCPNLHRRTSSNIPNVPFHRRNYTNMSSMSIENALDEPMVSGSEMTDDVSSSLKTEKSSSGNSNNNERTSSDSVQDNFPVSNDNNEQFEENFDFIDAAVSYAIQAKGLIPY